MELSVKKQKADIDSNLLDLTMEELEMVDGGMTIYPTHTLD